MKYLYGPIKSRRLGRSLGLSPIEFKNCNANCIYCQLGETKTKPQASTIKVSDIIEEFKQFLLLDITFDVVTIVGDGEPTLLNDLDKLCFELKKLCDKPIALITNGFIFSYEDYTKFNCFDLILPSLECFDQTSFEIIKRPMIDLSFDEFIYHLAAFSKQFPGQLWLEVMLIEGYNTKLSQLTQLHHQIQKIKATKIDLITVLRPAANKENLKASEESIRLAQETLNALYLDGNLIYDQSINEQDIIASLLAIIKRHPLNRFEIENLLSQTTNSKAVINALLENKEIKVVDYHGIETFIYTIDRGIN